VALSYTDMARMLTPRRPGIRAPTGLAGDDVDMSSPAAIEAWINSLPPSIRAELQNSLKNITLSLPAATQIQIANRIVSSGHELPFGMPLDGLGCQCDQSVNGLGQWGELASAIASIGSNLAVAKISGDSNASIAKSQAAAEAAIAKAQAQAAAAQANAAAASKAPMLKSIAVWGGISLTLAVGLGAIILLRRSKKK